MDILHNLQWVLPLRSPALTQFAVGFSWLGYTTFIVFFIALIDDLVVDFLGGTQSHLAAAANGDEMPVEK